MLCLLQFSVHCVNDYAGWRLNMNAQILVLRLQDENNGLCSTFKTEQKFASSPIALSNYLPCLYSSELELPNSEPTCFMVVSLFLLHFQLPEGQMSSVSWTVLAITYPCIQYDVYRLLSGGLHSGHSEAYRWKYCYMYGWTFHYMELTIWIQESG